MTKRIFSVSTYTPTQQADGLLTSNTYMGIAPSAATQQVVVTEIYQAGQASASAYNASCLAYASTVSASRTAMALPAAVGYVNGNASVLSTPEVTFVAATTNPTRSSATSVARLRLGFNAFGGIVRWVAAPSEEWIGYGTAVNVGEFSLSCENTGTAGAQGTSIIYEVL
jgi:hypothetical protein